MMRVITTLGLILSLSFGAISCASSQKTFDSSKEKSEKIMDRLNNSGWVLKRIDSENRDFVPTEGQEALELNFADNYYSSSDGCNGIGGEFTAEDNKVIFKSGMSTMRYCGDEMAHLIYKVPLAQTKSFVIKKDQLQLLDENNEVIATYVKKETE